MTDYYIPFTKEMKKTHTILVPNMLPTHFKLVIQVLRSYGYKMELLETSGPEITEKGLRYVHNDTCYPAILVIGQFIEAIESGRYDPDKVALILFQTGGGCRASNYISLLRKALKKSGHENVPVISFSLSSIEKHPGFSLTPAMLYKMLYGAVYGDLIANLKNQCKPYEKFNGDTDALCELYTEKTVRHMQEDRLFFLKAKDGFSEIVQAFKNIKMERTPKIRVGVVGEIFVKYSPLGNNNLEKFLLGEGAEVVCPGLLDFCMYSVHTAISDCKLYGMKKSKQLVSHIFYRVLEKLQGQLAEAIAQAGIFDVPTPFENIKRSASRFIGTGAQMGEGWLLPGEMIELYEKGVKNIVCTQPFGCLPNHIFGKGMMKPLKDKMPDLNIVAIDYDPGATRVNQENRIKLMLSAARPLFEKESGETEKKTVKTAK